MRDIGRRSFFTAAGALATASAIGSDAYATGHARDAASADEYVDVQLLNITDLHGYLQAAPAANSVIRGAHGKTYTVGGVAYMAAHLERLRAGRRNSLFFAPGDLFSGWEFDAASFADEPTIEVLNTMGLDFASAGNHEFDKSARFLTSHMQKGDAYPVTGRDGSFRDSTGRRFRGADFPYYSANMVWDDERGGTVLPPYNVEYVDAGRGRRLPIGFIHLTALGTENFPGSYQPGLRTLDEIATANRCAAELKARGVNAIVLSMHDGAVAGGDFESGSNPSGPAYELALRVSPDIDAIVTGHWHTAFTMMVPDPDGVPRPFVEAGCYGQLINEINLRLDPDTGAVVRALTTSTNHPNTRDVTPDREVRAITDYWAGYGARRAATPIGRQSGSFTRRRNALGESTMGNLVADWALWAGRQPHGPMDDPGGYRNIPAELAVIAVAPRVGQAIIGGDLVRDEASDGTVTFGQAWHAVGFGDPIMTVTVTGAQIHDALEEQWAPVAGGLLGFAPLAVSGNVHYTFDAAGPVGRRVNPDAVFVNGTALDPRRRYRLAAPSYTLINQDGYSAFGGFTEPVRHTRDFESFVEFVRGRRELAPAPLNRVSAVNTKLPGARIGTVPGWHQQSKAAADAVPRPEAALRSASAAGLRGLRAAGGFRVPC
ncbi:MULTISPECIES: 5'-nucleotidase C-terminal domain-containing protein [Streptomyces]|uniref:Bifunctional metallophosphatase/5'-nucleotidase n=1 Tax=Streptomyces celluloflavus TaxID=58344 RepID=A0ABW7RA77_9ACTN|nr:bifunctional metallophosphatase/5'-nucleotidase [Streptomyces sp. SID7805]WSK11309.1 bifunctional metallophosphatase/5'-nucleotidase [Streptomyces celluloflavus]